MIVLQCINLCPVTKIQCSSVFTPAYLQDMFQNMFQFSTFNRFDQIVIGKHFKCFFIEFFIFCHQHNRDIMSFQAHCPYSFQTPALITIQSQKYQITDLMSLCQSFQKTLSSDTEGALHQEPVWKAACTTSVHPFVFHHISRSSSLPLPCFPPSCSF